MNIRNFEDFQIYLNRQNIFDLLGIDKLGVFGSFARDEPFNDIDILIETDISNSDLMLLKHKLERDIDKPVDIVLEKFAEPIIRLRARRDLRYASKPSE